MKQLFFRIMKQHSPVLWLGGLRDTIQRTMIYWTLFNAATLLVLAYDTRFGNAIHKFMPWFTFPMFIGVGVVVFITLSLIDHKLIHPSQVHYQQREAWKHKSPVKKEVDKLKADIANTRVDVEQIKKDIQEIINILKEAVTK